MKRIYMSASRVNAYKKLEKSMVINIFDGLMLITIWRSIILYLYLCDKLCDKKSYQQLFSERLNLLFR